MRRPRSSARATRRSSAAARRSATGTTEAFQIQSEELTPAEQTTLTRALNGAFDAETSVQSVSSSFGRQIAEGAILAIIVSLLLVTIYISFRFQPKFAGPVMVSLLHDVLITVGIYALLGREVTTATVAAVLTVLGYSIYDTIIILDRIRENIPLMRRASFRTMANVSLWETIPRSLATTFITLLPISALYFFGGETLKDFAFALLVGIGAGAYSSIFIAAPLRRGAQGAGAGVCAPPGRRRARRRRLGRRPAEGGGGARRRAPDARSDSRTSSRAAATARPRPRLRRTARRRRLRRPRPTSRSASAAASAGRRAPMAAPDSNSAFALRQLLEELGAQVRNGVEKLGDLPQDTGDRLARELGLARREELEALELRLAQLEHRLKLLEQQP